MQFDCRLTHVLQLLVHAMHTLLTPTKPGEQVATQVLPSKLRVMQAVQLYANLSQVAQSFVVSHASANPELL